MKIFDCVIGFIVAFLGGVLAGLSFSFISNKLIAGAVAGLGFVCVGLLLFRYSLKASKPYSWVTFYTSLIHLFGISLPMIIVRWLNVETPFAQLHIWGIQGHQFHAYSMQFYYVLLGGIVLDGLRAVYIRTKKNQSSSALVP